MQGVKFDVLSSDLSFKTPKRVRDPHTKNQITKAAGMLVNPLKQIASWRMMVGKTAREMLAFYQSLAPRKLLIRDFPQLLKMFTCDDPDFEAGVVGHVWPEVGETIIAPIGSLKAAASWEIKQVDLTVADEKTIKDAVDALSGFKSVGMDMEWACAEVTGTGHPGPVSVTQLAGAHTPPTPGGVCVVFYLRGRTDIPSQRARLR